jgi:hypothetical protein
MNKFYLNSVKNTFLSSKPSTSIRLLLMVLFVSITPLISFGQCTYPAGATSVGTYSFCIDNSNTITTATVNAGKYALLNVVKGFTYTFTVGNVFTTGNTNEIISLYDTSDVGITVASGPGGASITSWVATYSGQIKILLSRGGSAPSTCVNDNSAGGTISLTLNSLNNSQDSQTAYGTDTWVGHVYNSVAGASPNPFTNANYAGYYNVSSETINENFGGDTNCFAVLSNGTQRASIYTQQFAVRYRMKSTRLAGYYFMNANADDGIRVTVDGITVLNDWTDHANAQYCNNLIYLNGNSDIILDYYENAGGNVVGFNLTPVSGNTISSYADINVCSGTSPGVLNGSSMVCTGTTNTTYQWQSSTDNVNFTNISGATNEDYTLPTVTTTTVDVKYYRRVLKAFGVAITASNPATGSVKVTTSSSAPGTPGIITGSATQCAGNTLQTYSIAAIAKATSYNWTLPANWTITAGAGTNSITVSIASNGITGNVSVNAINGCGIGYASSEGSGYKWVVVSTPTVAGTVTPANTNVCLGSNSTNLSLSGQTGSVLRWESSTDNFATAGTPIVNTSTSLTASGLTTDTYYRAVVQSGGCNVLNTSSVKLTVVGSMANPGGISINGVSYPVNGSTTNCASTTMTFSIASIANATSYTWVVGGGWTIVSGQGTTSVSVTTGSTSQSNNISVYATNGTCPQTGSTYLYVTLTNTAAPTGTAAQSFCSGTTVANLAATGSNIKWYALSTGGSALASTTVLTNGTHYYASQNPSGCESTTRFDVLVTINSSLTITPNKVDETCPSSNNGSISPTLSGGLSNVRYIKLTQKIADWQQVAEIEAFEIFTDTNVARSSNGATATASSFYTLSGPYPPAQAIDGNISGNNNFWHSGNTNINESITVDLASGKNIDYIKIYNRSDCCQQRGQNMLLELFDSSNTLVYSRTIDLYQSGANVPVNVNVLDVSWADGATTLNRTGLDSGTYILNCADAVGCSVSSPIVIGSSATNNNWNGTIWDSGTPPTINGTQNLVFNAGFTTNADLSGCSCTVNSGAVIIQTGNNLILGGKLTVNTPGTLTFENNASLVQTAFTGANAGNVTYKRATTTIREFDYTYWSSPVAAQNLLALSPTTKLDKFFTFDASTDYWVQANPSTTTMTIGKGYIIRGIPLPSPPIPPGFYNFSFVGIPNNGDLSIPVTNGTTSNLIGNPYPSAIYADQFLFDNKSVIDGTIYFWTHNTPIAIGTPDPGTGAWAYSGNDYASYSLTGGVGTGTGTSAISSGPAVKPTGKIAAGQSFFTTSTAAGGTVKFTNTMRVDGSGNPLNNSNFYKTKNTKAKTNTTIEKNRVWLNLTNTQGAFKQTLVGYITGATNTWDNLYDGESFDGNDFLDFYSINQDMNLTIQGRALPFDENDEIPLGYRIAVDGTFTINIDETDGLLADQPVYIEDKLTNTIFDLKAGNYTFKTAAGTFNDRFVLRYTSKTLGTSDFDVANNKIIVSVKNKQIKINSFVETIDKVAIYDESGRQIYQRDKVNSNELLIPNFVSSHQILIVKTSLQNGKTVTNKIIY